MATPYRLVCRQFSTTNCLLKKPNITKPRLPGMERRILNAVTVPVFPPDPRSLPKKCYDDMLHKEQARKSELREAYLAFRLKQATKMFHENKMVAICHILPMTPRDLFNVRTKIVTAGMTLMFARNDLAREAVRGTRLQNLEPYLTSDNVYIISQEFMVPQLVTLLRKTPELQLLGGLVEDRILSRDEMQNIAKLPPLDITRGELVTILAASASKTSRLLGRHQQELSANLEQLIRQGGGGKKGDGAEKDGAMNSGTSENVEEDSSST